MILCLGEFDTTRFPVAERQQLVATLLALYRNDPDPGLHAAAEWLLRHEGWDQADKLSDIDSKLSVNDTQLEARKATDKRRWYVNTEGQTFVILNADKPFRMGSPAEEPNRREDEVLHQQEIPHTFAIASKTVTKAQFRHFHAANPDVWIRDDGEFSPTDDCPQVAVDWYDAARYCNWLNKQEGIPAEQWCYEPIKDGPNKGYCEGMKPANGYLQRCGYRLPTEAEWEFACRAGSQTSRYYGLSVKLLPQYAWFVENSHQRSWPAGMKKPNDYGLFDMLGNVWEWCDDVYDASGTRTDVQGKVGRVLRGGSFFFQASRVRSAYRLNDVPTNRDVDFGLRVARTWRPKQ